MVKEYMAQMMWLRQNLKTAYIIIWGQCSDVMRARAEAKLTLRQQHQRKRPNQATQGNQADHL